MFHKSLKTNSQLPFYKQMITVVQHISLCIIENWSSVTSFSQRRVADRLERRIQSQLCVQQTLKTLSLYLLEEIWTTWFCDNFWVWDNKESKKLKKEKIKISHSNAAKVLYLWMVCHSKFSGCWDADGPEAKAFEMFLQKTNTLLRLGWNPRVCKASEEVVSLGGRRLLFPQIQFRSNIIDSIKNQNRTHNSKLQNNVFPFFSRWPELKAGFFFGRSILSGMFFGRGILGFFGREFSWGRWKMKR